ncbi:MAG: HD domain-containing protein [Candidatus Omnitrophica bacterium]|nr:HD domain-containing protein [Candidatus Omnitrophota bacterium]
MDEMGIWQQIFPEVLPLRGLEQGEFHHLDGWDHSLATLAELEKLLKQLPRKISPIDRGKVKEYLNYEISGQRPRLWLLKLACLLHDIGKPQTKTLGPDNRIHFYTHEKSGAQLAVKIGRRLKFSSREIAALKSLVLFHLRAGQLVNRKPALRAKFRFFRDTADNALLILLLSIADRRAMRGRLSREKEFVFLEEELFLMIGEYFKNKEKAQKIIPLFNGYELMDFLSISPGPVIGKILRELKEAQAVNQIRDKQQAKNFAQKIYRKINEAVL